jgi:molecular chaperone GrpE
MAKNKKQKDEEIVEESIQEETPAVEAEIPAPEGGMTGEEGTELANLQMKADEYLEGWQRARAEFANYKKRVEKERQVTYQNAAGSIVLKVLPVLDDMERALKNRPTDGAGAAWADGIELIYRKFRTAIESEGVMPMDVVGEEFDPNMHEAVVSTPSDEYESGLIIEELQRGYRIGDRVLRPAMVRVAA